MALIRIPTKFQQNRGWTAIARVLGQDGAAITQASLSQIDYGVYDRSSKTPLVALSSFTGALTVSAVVFDTLQTDARWTVDNTGYNFLYTVAAGAFANKTRQQAVEFIFTPASGEVFGFEFYGPVIGTNITAS